MRASDSNCHRRHSAEGWRRAEVPAVYNLRMYKPPMRTAHSPQANGRIADIRSRNRTGQLQGLQLYGASGRYLPGRISKSLWSKYSMLIFRLSIALRYNPGRSRFRRDHFFRKPAILLSEPQKMGREERRNGVKRQGTFLLLECRV